MVADPVIKKPLLTEEQICFWLFRFRSLDTKSLGSHRQLIDRFVNKVVVYDDKILRVFNYKDTLKQVSFNDIKCPDLNGGATLQKKT